MSLAPIRGSGGTAQGPPTEGRVGDDLREGWSSFMADPIAGVETCELSSRGCSCVILAFHGYMIHRSLTDIIDVHTGSSDFEVSHPPSRAGWGWEGLDLGAVNREASRSVPFSSRELTGIVEAVGGMSRPAGGVPLLGDVDQVLLALRRLGLDDLAGDLEYKKVLIEDDPDESPISLESARGFYAFVAAGALRGFPSVTVDSRGYVGLEWIIPDPLRPGFAPGTVTTGRGDDHLWGRGDGVLGMWFLPNGLVRVCGTSGPVGQGVDRMAVNSTVPPAHVIGEIMPFLSRLEGT